MRKQIFLVTTLLLFATVFSCNSKQKTTSNKQVATGDNSMTSVDWPGTYQGILPCADCEGLKTQLKLNNDLTYILETQYLGKSDSVYMVSGKFKWNETGSSVILENSGNQYQVGENILFHLDNEGKRITDELADKYKLVKETSEITGKYWKLVKLNGQSVQSMIKEPFITFNADENLVSGNSGCNSFRGKYEITDMNKIHFSPFAMTKMACIGYNIENDFMAALAKTTAFTLNSNTLVLQDEYETSVLKFESDFFK